MTETEHNHQVDVARGLLATIVFVLHATEQFSQVLFLFDFFFCVSAVLITARLTQIRKLANSPASKAGMFFKARTRRLFLPYFLVVLATYAISRWLPWYFDYEAPSARTFLPYVFFVQFLELAIHYGTVFVDGLQVRYDFLLVHTWSLAIEEQFYLVLGSTFFFLARPSLTFVAILLVTCGIFFRYIEAAHFLIVYRFDAFGYGILIALYGPTLASSRHGVLWLKRLVAWMTLVIVAFTIAGALGLHSIGVIGQGPETFHWDKFSVVTSAYCALLTAAVHLTKISIPRWLGISAGFMGIYCYEFYLTHAHVIYLIRELRSEQIISIRWRYLAPLAFVISLGLAVALSKLNKAVFYSHLSGGKKFA